MYTIVLFLPENVKLLGNLRHKGSQYLEKSWSNIPTELSSEIVYDLGEIFYEYNFTLDSLCILLHALLFTLTERQK